MAIYHFPTLPPDEIDLLSAANEREAALYPLAFDGSLELGETPEGFKGAALYEMRSSEDRRTYPALEVNPSLPWNDALVCKSAVQHERAHGFIAELRWSAAVLGDERPLQELAERLREHLGRDYLTGPVEEAYTSLRHAPHHQTRVADLLVDHLPAQSAAYASTAVQEMLAESWVAHRNSIPASDRCPVADSPLLRSITEFFEQEFHRDSPERYARQTALIVKMMGFGTTQLTAADILAPASGSRTEPSHQINGLDVAPTVGRLLASQPVRNVNFVAGAGYPGVSTTRSGLSPSGTPSGPVKPR